MKRLDIKEARKIFGRLARLKAKTAPQNTFPDTKYSCCLSFLHDTWRAEPWAKQIREIINRREEL